MNAQQALLEGGSSGGEVEEKSLTFSEEESMSIPKVPLEQEQQQPPPPRREGSSSEVGSSTF